MKKVFALVAAAVVMLVEGIACATRITVLGGFDSASSTSFHIVVST